MTTAPVHLEGIHNFRAVAPYQVRGGRRIRERTIYRSGALDLMTPADEDVLSRQVQLSCVLDLRHPDESGDASAQHALSDAVRRLSLFPEHLAQESLIAELNGLYGTGPSARRYFHYLEIGRERFVEAFQLLSEEATYPVLVHCTAGKDRTGVLLALLMDVLGAKDEDIGHEYELSNQSIDRLIAYLESTGRVLEGTPEEIRERLATPAERITGFIELVRKEYGSSADYLQSIGVDEQRLERIQDMLTEQG